MAYVTAWPTQRAWGLAVSVTWRAQGRGKLQVELRAFVEEVRLDICVQGKCILKILEQLRKYKHEQTISSCDWTARQSMTITLGISTVTGATLMDEQRHRSHFNAQDLAYLGNTRTFSERDCEMR